MLSFYINRFWISNSMTKRLQSFCHTVAYPKPVDIETQHTLPEFIRTRGGVALKPGDGIIHSWLNRMLLPDTVGTGGDSHTRFPIGISFPAGSGLVATNPEPAGKLIPIGNLV